MYKVLFVCTANIYRSRFGEEVFNHLAIKNNLSSRAFSAGLKVGHYKTRKIYKPALDELYSLNIKPIRADESSIHVDDVGLQNFNKIICMDEKEHKPMVKLNPNMNKLKISYWDIIDEPLVSSKISLPKCSEKVHKLFDEVRKNKESK